MTETQFTDQVIDLARMAGWLVSHNRGNMRRHIQGNVGLPDLVMVHPEREIILFAELKVGKGMPTAEQLRWLDALANCYDSHSPDTHLIVRIWRPEDELQIISTLTGTRQSAKVRT